MKTYIYFLFLFVGFISPVNADKCKEIEFGSLSFKVTRNDNSLRFDFSPKNQKDKFVMIRLLYEKGDKNVLKIPVFIDENTMSKGNIFYDFYVSDEMLNDLKIEALFYEEKNPNVSYKKVPLFKKPMN